MTRRRAGVADANIQVELVEAGVDLGPAGQVAEHLEHWTTPKMARAMTSGRAAQRAPCPTETAPPRRGPDGRVGASMTRLRTPMRMTRSAAPRRWFRAPVRCRRSAARRRQRARTHRGRRRDDRHGKREADDDDLACVQQAAGDHLQPVGEDEGGGEEQRGTDTGGGMVATRRPPAAAGETRQR